MNLLEKIAIESLKESLQSALVRCHKSNTLRMEHERIFIKRDIEDAINIVKALEENNKN